MLYLQESLDILFRNQVDMRSKAIAHDWESSQLDFSISFQQEASATYELQLQWSTHT